MEVVQEKRTNRMANLEKFRQYHYDATVKVSENTRTLAISALAIVWLFKKQDGDIYVIPEALLWPLLFVFIALTLDFFQYVYRSIVWHVIFREKEKELEKNEITEETILYVNSWANNWAYLFFYLKVLCLIVVYYGLLVYFVNNIQVAK